MSKKMNPEQALAAMRDAVRVSKDDIEGGHHLADEVLCALLRHYGHHDIIEAYEDVEKWYA